MAFNFPCLVGVYEEAFFHSMDNTSNRSQWQARMKKIRRDGSNTSRRHDLVNFIKYRLTMSQGEFCTMFDLLFEKKEKFAFIPNGKYVNVIAISTRQPKVYAFSLVYELNFLIAHTHTHTTENIFKTIDHRVLHSIYGFSCRHRVCLCFFFTFPHTTGIGKVM